MFYQLESSDLRASPSLNLPPEGLSVTFGRMKKPEPNHCQVIGPKISKLHCSVYLEGGSVYLKDCSSNGTQLDSKKVKGDIRPFALGAILSFPGLGQDNVLLPTFTLSEWIPPPSEQVDLQQDLEEPTYAAGERTPDDACMANAYGNLGQQPPT